MIYVLENDVKKIEELIQSHLLKTINIRPRHPFEFYTLKGTFVSISIQAGFSYGSELNTDKNTFKCVEILSRSLPMTAEFRTEYEEYENGPLEYVPVEILASVIKHAIDCE